MWKETLLSPSPGFLPWRTMSVIWAVAVVVRLVNLAALPMEPGFLLNEDAWLYWANALSLQAQGTFLDTASSGRMPGYFLLLAGLMGVFGPSLFAVLAVQAFLDSATCVLVGMIGARLSLSVGLVAGLLAGVAHGYAFPVITSQVVARSPAALTGTALAVFTGLWELSDLILAPTFGAVRRRSAPGPCSAPVRRQSRSIGSMEPNNTARAPPQRPLPSMSPVTRTTEPTFSNARAPRTAPSIQSSRERSS